ncbi:HNH/ENDO VII family nuclease [Bacillus sonorensis]|nr:HNH/ENDO VII family nuclease [Bacillus sonorensis]
MKHPNKNITNLELMKSGKAPIGEDGKPINLHHLIQKEPGTMLEILHTTHKKYHKVLHQLVEKGIALEIILNCNNNTIVSEENTGCGERKNMKRA